MKNKKSIITFLISLFALVCLGFGVNNYVVYALGEDYVQTNSFNQGSLTSTIPTSYNSDYNNLSYITSVKDQDPYGMCWTFATVACAEADAIKNHGASLNIDLSEWHLGYFSYNANNEQTGDVITSGTIPYYDCGGNTMCSVFTLSNWIGFANESVAPYSTLVNNPNATIAKSKMYEHEYLLDNVYMYEADEITNVKNAILTYGAVSTSYNSSTSFLNSSTYAQYCDTAYTANHAVAVVGWDDNYSKDNFYTYYGGTPTSNGAWLVKNSWG